MPTAPKPPKTPKPCCERPKVTVHASDYGLHTWQPFDYGTRAWFHIYSGARDRTEGVVADIRENMHLKGGRNDVRIRGLAPTTMIAAILGMTRNLQLAGQLRAPSGRTHIRTSKRVYKLPASHKQRMLAKLERRQEDRNALEKDVSRPMPPLANSPPKLP